MFEFNKELNKIKKGNHTYDLPPNLSIELIDNFVKMLNEAGDVSHWHVKELIEDFLG